MTRRISHTCTLAMHSVIVVLASVLVLTRQAWGSSDFETADSGTFVSDYHFPMVADDVRNMKFYEALKKAIVPNVSRVIDVGAGTMLLSMMAHDLGAANILGVEENRNMASVAREVLRVNKYTNNSKKGKIRLFEGSFEYLFVGHKQLKQPADIFISETFDAALIGEKFLEILTHAKKKNIVKPNATIIPNSAVLYGQLLESTLSLRRGLNNAPFMHAGKYNLEPLRQRRPSGVFTVRYLNEQNAVRQKLSGVVPLFLYDFQNYDLSKNNFAYSCIIFEITEADEGIFDSIGLWFNLYLDNEKKLIVSNAPSTSTEDTHTAPCWMQAVYRVSKDVMVRRGDILRIQLVQMPNNYVIGEVGNGEYNIDSRLIRFIAVNCENSVTIYSYREGNYETVVDPSIYQSDEFTSAEYYVGTIPAMDKKNSGDGESYTVIPGRVFQSFKMVTKLPSGRMMGMFYQLPDSTAEISGTAKVKAKIKLPLDTYRLTCPSS